MPDTRPKHGTNFDEHFLVASDAYTDHFGIKHIMTNRYSLIINSF